MVIDIDITDTQFAAAMNQLNKILTNSGAPCGKELRKLIRALDLHVEEDDDVDCDYEDVVFRVINTSIIPW